MLIGGLAQGDNRTRWWSHPLWRALWAQIELYRDDTAWPARGLPPGLLLDSNVNNVQVDSSSIRVICSQEAVSRQLNLL